MKGQQDQLRGGRDFSSSPWRIALVASRSSTLSGGSGATDGYHAMYRNVTGVKFGTQVLYEGYPIGQVEAVTPVPEGGGMRFRVDFERAPRIGAFRPTASSPSRPRACFRRWCMAICGRAKVGDVVEAGRPPAEPRVREHVLGGRPRSPSQVKDIAVNDLRPLLATVNGTVDDLRRHPGRPRDGFWCRGIERPGDRPVGSACR